MALLYDMVTFEEMVKDWMADHLDEMSDLEVDSIKYEDGCCAAYAHDNTSTYLLTDDGMGNININYIGTR